MVGMSWLGALAVDSPKAAIFIAAAWIFGTWWGYITRISEEK